MLAGLSPHPQLTENWNCSWCLSVCLFTEEAQRGRVTCPRSCSKYTVEAGFLPGIHAPELRILPLIWGQ